jgi:steroid delta-isomerase-like uncharacterized protein
VTDIDLKARTQQIFDAFNAHDAGAAAAYFADTAELRDVGVARPAVGPEQIAAVYTDYLSAIPDAHICVDRLVAEGETVVVEWTNTGTHRGKLMGIPATGKFISVKGVSIIRYHQAMAVADTRVWDLAGLLRQIGLLPSQSD